MDKIYYTAIQVHTICANGSEKFGAIASTTFSTSMDKKFMTLSMSGKTKELAKERLLKFLSDGVYKIEEVTNG